MFWGNRRLISNSSISFKGGFISKQKEFLQEADDAYAMTFRQLDMSHFAAYASRNMYMVVYKTLSYERPWAGISNKFKTTKWTLLEVDEEGCFLALKETVFDRVNVSKHLKLSVADDFKELWGVIVDSSGKYKIERITNTT